MVVKGVNEREGGVILPGNVRFVFDFSLHVYLSD